MAGERRERAQRQISSAATPAPCQSSFARSDSAIIATQSPIAETPIAPATRRRSRSRVVAAVTRRIYASDSLAENRTAGVSSSAGSTSRSTTSNSVTSTAAIGTAKSTPSR